MSKYSKGAEGIVDGTKKVVNTLSSFFGKAVKNPGKSIFGLSAADIGLTGGENIKEAFFKIAGWATGIDSKYAGPLVATAGAGIMGKLLGSGKTAALLMALTGTGFAFNHISENGLSGADLIAGLSVKEQANTL